MPLSMASRVIKARLWAGLADLLKTPINLPLIPLDKIELIEARRIMDMETRAELEKIHGRINDVKDRVTVLETQTPYTNAALARIEGSVDKMIAKMDRAKWAFYAPAIALFVAGLYKLFTSGALAL